jgi:hypothetical protein
MALAPAMLRMAQTLLNVRLALLSTQPSTAMLSRGATTGMVALLWNKPHSLQHVRKLAISLCGSCLSLSESSRTS